MNKIIPLVAFSIFLLIPIGAQNAFAGGNTIPIVDAGPDSFSFEGDTFVGAGSFVDPDTDTWTATVDYGDGGGPQSLALNPDKTFTLSHTYADDGLYAVTVSISDGTDTGMDTTTVIVDNVDPIVDAGPDSFSFEGDTFVGAGSFVDPGADTWTATVDYGDGGGPQSLALNPDKTFALSHTYADDGLYAVTVFVNDDDGGLGIDTTTVIVNNVNPIVDAGPDAIVNEGDTFVGAGSFVDPGADTWTATVDYGDGGGPQPLALNPDKTFALSHTYTSPGVFGVTVFVNDDDGGLGIDITTVTNNFGDPPIADAGGDQNPPLETFLVNFDGSGSTDDVGPITYSWDFDDGSPLSSDVAPSHVYTAPGIYTVTLTVTDSVGQIGTDIAIVVISLGEPPIADADGPYSGDEGSAITFDGSGSFDVDGPLTYSWDFGDGSPLGSGVAPSHVYSAAGSYTVTLTVTDNGGQEDTDTSTVSVEIGAPGDKVIGGEIIPIQTTSLLLAGAQSFSWIIPVLLSIAAAGLIFFKKRN